MNKIQMVDLKSQYQNIKNEIDEAIFDVINTCQFINGKQVKLFQQNLAKYLHSKNVITCGNGTDALQIALMSLGLKAGDEIITTPFTFIATAEVVALLGLKLVFADVNEDTFTINPDLIEKAITEKTKAIVPVHLYGQCADMNRINEIAKKHNLYVIEDNAQAIGAEYKFNNGEVKKSGNMGTIGCTSFFPSKNLGCYGDGGAISTNDDELADKMRMIVNHGSKIKYTHEVVGINSRLDTIQAAILDVKLKYLDKYCQARQKAADFYDKELKNVDFLEIPQRQTNSAHVFHQYTLKTKGICRDKFKQYLSDNNIPSMIYYPSPLHLQKAYSYLGYKEGDFPISEDLCKRIISLPMHTELTTEEQTYIVETIKKIE